MGRTAAIRLAGIAVVVTAAVVASQPAVFEHTADRGADRTPPATANGAATPHSETIHKSVVLSKTPDEPGRIDATVTYDIPDSVTELSVSPPNRTTRVSASGFDPSTDGYEWTGRQDAPTLRITVTANQSAAAPPNDERHQAGEYSFVDAGDWALVTVPTVRTSWRWSDADDVSVSVSESVSVDGPGATGGEIAYLGPVIERTRTAHGQTITLVTPERAGLVEPPAAILDTVTAAAGRLQVGGRDDHVWLLAAPRAPLLGPRGVEYGGSDAWVGADERLNTATNVWLHEYVHTRQAYDTTASARWTIEATAQYYAALLSLRLNATTNDAFRRTIAKGADEPWRSAVLSTPETWAVGANYRKGALVWGALDRRVRGATDRTADGQAVLRRLNDREQPVSNADVVAAVAAAGDDDAAAATKRDTTSPTAPSMWPPTARPAPLDSPAGSTPIGQPARGPLPPLNGALAPVATTTATAHHR
ncbi:hypothetical protein PNQ29_03930 [Halobacterium salinarum]|uniref:Uncharacterized protein n=3 Tax=Halobacterium salinarum TaxID=2242 RepID=A0A841H8K0_HALSI|nr:hypothetical protein [Halobacterium salinarum]AAG19700.1 conserved hypothetical protein [Halobacterium salinarum NRC-1]MBB6088702.1 hypothetical protein [Halobacterium salinarum]MDL0118890.1 hypothetical protein [Halobacterium salinarum]MDL0130002.1 hypothetical protein [Halobacterium salinarum]UEB91053.1 hypothetical protein LJ422_05595 [Halobacterium salinarum NRC-34001]